MGLSCFITFPIFYFYFMNDEQRALWSKILLLEIDINDASFPFSARLARDNNWNIVFAKRVIQEYKKFLFLCCQAGHAVTPSDEVDQAWHLHLVYTRSYWNDLCRDTLGRPLHHGPTKGGDQERAKFKSNYANTLDSYRRLFDAEPPVDIWPPEGKRFGEIHFSRVNHHTNWVVSKKYMPMHPGVLVASLLLGIVIPVLFIRSDGDDFTIPDILVFVIFLYLSYKILRYTVIDLRKDVSIFKWRWQNLKIRKKDTPFFHTAMVKGFVLALFAGFILGAISLSFWTGFALFVLLGFMNWWLVMRAMYTRKREETETIVDTPADAPYHQQYGSDADYYDPIDLPNDWGLEFKGFVNSGCSGDLGCTSCSGCSGCGGCGGD